MNGQRIRGAVLCLVVLWVALAGGRAFGLQCDGDWDGRFTLPGTNFSVLAFAQFDDGSGPSLYIGGRFNRAGGRVIEKIARWNGESWDDLDGGIKSGQSSIQAMAVFDDGNGPALYAGGFFDHAGGEPMFAIARWDGTRWSSIGGGFSQVSRVHALEVFDDGSGEALYVGGQFQSSLGFDHIARWDGAAWSGVGGSTNGPVEALTTFDDGSGEALYAGGAFTQTGGIPANRVARWDGTSWSALGGGVDNLVYALRGHDDGSGPSLFAGGAFASADGNYAPRVAKWDGSAWTSVGGGLGLVDCRALEVHDEGNGPVLFAGGLFEKASGITANGIARWDGASWSSLGDGPGVDRQVDALKTMDLGNGPVLLVGGDFKTAGTRGLNYVARWDGTSFHAFGSGQGVSDKIEAFETFDDGSGEALYAGGELQAAGEVAARGIARWDGTSWSALGGGVGGSIGGVIFSLRTFDDGSGDQLYAAGRFETAGGMPAANIAAWDGANWSPLGSGVTGYTNLTSGRALAVFDDGGGPALYVGGHFTLAGGVAANHIAKWDGFSWSALGAGLDHDVLALEVFDDGGGPALYAGGTFQQAGGAPAAHLARWDGVGWSAVGDASSRVTTMLRFDDGTGDALYVGGGFTTIAGISANYIARFDGTGWSPLGSGFDDGVFSLAAHDSGDGPELWAGGDFYDSGVYRYRLARWTGTSWKTPPPEELGPRSAPAALRSWRDGHPNGNALYVGAGTDEGAGALSTNISRRTNPPPHAITSVTPDSGSYRGGNSVTIRGEGFTPSSAVAFHGVLSPSVTFVDSTRLTVVVPRGDYPRPPTPGGISPATIKLPESKVDVVVSTGECTSTLVGGYTYRAIY